MHGPGLICFRFHVMSLRLHFGELLDDLISLGHAKLDAGRGCFRGKMGGELEV